MSEAYDESNDPFLDIMDRISAEMDQGEHTGMHLLETLASLVHDRLGDRMDPDGVREFWESVLYGMDEASEDDLGQPLR